MLPPAKTGDGRSGPPPDWRLVAGPRLILAAAGLVVVFLVPEQPDRWVALTYTALVLHTLYAATVYLLLHFRTGLGNWIDERAHWLDLMWYTVLITLSSGTNSIFFFGYMFAILVASFRWGFASGIRVTLASVLLFATFGYLGAPNPTELDHQRFLIRPVFLLTIGYITASRGGLELSLQRRLRFLKDVSTVSNPRFGIDRTIGTLMHRLLALYEADSCALVVHDEPAGTYRLRRVRASEPEGPVPDTALPEPLGRLFLAFPQDRAVGYADERHARTWRVGTSFDERGAPRRDPPAMPPESCAAIAEALDATSFVSIFLGLRHQGDGRLYLGFRSKRAFQESDVEFLAQVVDHVFPLIENIRLVDQLASSAAREERRKIARDIHDSVIQPYVGLRFGLSALRQRLADRGEDAGAEVERLIGMADSGIEDLRRQVFTIKEGETEGGSLIPAVSRFAARFSEVTGIAVEVEADGDVPVNDRVAGEAFQMVAEGLSNVRRHTHAARAFIRLACRDGRLRIEIEDEGRGEPAVGFTPRSISERARALGGRAEVLARPGGGTTVRVEIPL